MFKTYSYILNENIAGYGSGEKKPSGYCKIKCLDDKNTVDLNVRNIETANNKYNCYLIYFKDKYYGVNIGEASVSGENNIMLKKEIGNNDKINTDELTGFAITNEIEDDRAILYGYNDEVNLWDGFFVKTDKEDDKENNKNQSEQYEETKVDEEENEEDIENTEESIEDKEDSQETIEETIVNEEGSQEAIEEFIVNKEENEENIEGIDYKEDTILDSIAIENIIIEKEQIKFNEDEYRKIHTDDLIHMEKFRWSIYNNILMYISCKKYGFVLYKENLDNSTVAIPIEENYIGTFRNRYTYIKADNKDYEGYIILEW